MSNNNGQNENFVSGQVEIFQEIFVLPVQQPTFLLSAEQLVLSKKNRTGNSFRFKINS